MICTNVQWGTVVLQIVEWIEMRCVEEIEMRCVEWIEMRCVEWIAIRDVHGVWRHLARIR